MLDRWVENGLLDVLEENGVGSIAFTPLAQGLLTNKYLNGVPGDSRAASASVFLNESNITPEVAQDQSFEPNRSSAESESRPIRSRLGPSRRPGDICPDWGKQGEPDRGQCGRLEQPGVLEGRTGSH